MKPASSAMGCWQLLTALLLFTALGPALALVTHTRPLPRQTVANLHTLGNSSTLGQRQTVSSYRAPEREAILRKFHADGGKAAMAEARLNLRAFQAQRGLPQTGTFNRLTLNALDREQREYQAMDAVALAMPGASVATLRMNTATGKLWRVTPRDGDSALLDSLSPLAQSMRQSADEKPSVLFAPNMSDGELEKLVSSLNMAGTKGKAPMIVLKGFPKASVLNQHVQIPVDAPAQVRQASIRVDSKGRHLLDAPVGTYTVRLQGKTRALIERAQEALAEFLYRRASGVVLNALMPQLMAEFRQHLNEQGSGLQDTRISYIGELRTRQWAALPGQTGNALA